MPLCSPRSSPWELELRRRLVAGDETALTDLYDQFASFVFGLALRVTSSEHAAEDVTQDVFIAVWENPEAFHPERGALRSWIGTLAHHRAVDWVRREEANRRRGQRQPMSPPPDIEETATGLVLAERVRQAVETLPPEQRQALRMAYFEGRTYRQVARALEIPEGTAKSRLRIALRRVAVALEPEGIEQWA